MTFVRSVYMFQVIFTVSVGFLLSGLQTPILHLNNSAPYESEEFKVTCSAPDEKGGLTFNFYKTFGDGQPQRIKKQQTTNNVLETTLTLSHIGDCFLSCDYEISLVSGPTSSNISNEIQVKVKGIYMKLKFSTRHKCLKRK